jgi:hypothetical protein
MWQAAAGLGLIGADCVNRFHGDSPASHRAELLAEAVFWLAQFSDEDISSLNEIFASWNVEDAEPGVSRPRLRVHHPPARPTVH